MAGCAIRWRTPKAPRTSIGLVANDLLKGASFFPFVLLSISIVDPKFLKLLVETNHLVLFLSGVIAALYVIGEFISAAQGKPDKSAAED